MIQNIKKFYPVVSSSILLVVPAIASAQKTGKSEVFIQDIQRLINLIIALLFAVAALVFIGGIVRFIMSGDNEEARKKATGFILFGIIGIAIMFAFWGLVAVIVDYFNLGAGGTPSQSLPTITPLPRQP